MSPNFLTPPPHLPVRGQITRVAQIKPEITSKSRQESNSVEKKLNKCSQV